MTTHSRAALLLALACGSGMAQAAPAPSLEAQALAHWIHYTVVNGHLAAEGPVLVVEPGGSLRVMRVGLPAAAARPAAARPAALRIPDPAPQPSRATGCTGG